MTTGVTVRQLAARLIHAGDKPADLIPVVYERGGVMRFHFERAGSGGQTAGYVEQHYRDAPTLLREIRDSQRLTGVPTVEMMYEAFNMNDAFRDYLGRLG